MKTRDVLDLVVLAALWGASYLFMRVAAPEFGPIPLIEVRVAIAALFLLPILWLQGGFGEFRAHAVPIVAVGIINSALPFALIAFALLSVTAGFASILNATSPLFGALVAYIWLQEKLSLSRVIGLIIGFCGVVVLVWGKASFKPGGGGIAVVAALSACLLYGIASNFTKKRLADVNPLVIAAGSQFGATLVLLPAAALSWPATVPPLKAWLAVIALGIACTGIAYVLYFRLISNIGPTRTISVTFLIPVFAMLWGALFLSERVTPNMVIGCTIILLGTALAIGLLKFERFAVTAAPG